MDRTAQDLEFLSDMPSDLREPITSCYLAKSEDLHLSTNWTKYDWLRASYVCLKTEPMFPYLTSISIRGTQCDPRGFKYICDALRRNRSITYLSVVKIDLADYEAKALAASLCTNCTLLFLDLSENQITDFGGVEIARMLRTNNSLVALRLQQNLLTHVSVAAFAKQLRYNYMLDHLALGGNKIELSDIENIEDLAKIASMELDLAALKGAARTELAGILKGSGFEPLIFCLYSSRITSLSRAQRLNRKNMEDVVSTRKAAFVVKNLSGSLCAVDFFYTFVQSKKGPARSAIDLLHRTPIRESILNWQRYYRYN